MSKNEEPTQTAIDKSQFITRKLDDLSYSYAQAAEITDKVLIYIATEQNFEENYDEIPALIWFLADIRNLFAELAKKVDNEKLEVYL